jgi:hypothetical protein
LGAVELSSIKSLLLWSKKRWLIASVTAVATGIFISLPTAILKTPIFGREIPVTSWSVPVVIATSILSGMLFASYVNLYLLHLGIAVQFNILLLFNRI